MAANLRPLLAYDAHCGACLWFRRLVGFLDPSGRLGFVSLDEAAESGRLDPVPRAARSRSFHLIFPDGGVQSGAEAIPSLLGLLPPTRVASMFVDTLPAARPLVGTAYGLLSRMHQSGSCRRQGSALSRSGRSSA